MRPVASYFVVSASQSSIARNKYVTYLPEDQTPSFRSQHEHPDILLRTSRKSQTSYPLWEWHNSLLATKLAIVNMYDCLLGLRREDVRCACREAIGLGGAFLKTRFEGRIRLVLVEMNADVFRVGSLGLLGRIKR